MNVTAAGNGIVNASMEVLSGAVNQVSGVVEAGKQKWDMASACTDNIWSCLGHGASNWFSSLTYSSIKWGAYNFPNGVACLPGLGYSLAKLGFNKFVCPEQESTVCNITRIVGRKIQDVSSAKYNDFEQWATNSLAPNHEEIFQNQTLLNKAQGIAAPEKFSALNIIAPAIFAGFCAHKSLENLNNGLFHAYQLLSFQRNHIETAAGGHTHIDNRSSTSLVWSVVIESLLAAGWGCGTYVTTEAIQDALQNSGVPNAELLAAAFVTAAIIAPTAWRWTNDAIFKGRTNDPTHFDSATATPQRTREAMQNLDPSGKYHDQLDPHAPTPTSSEESDGDE